MVATKIVGLYSTIWEPILRDELSRQDLVDFSRKLPQLRKSFTCSVCDQLLTNREVISPSNCLEHFACKACRGMDREPGRKCPKCEDWSTFEKNGTLDMLLQSYQMFCLYILTCERIVRLLEEMHEGEREPGFDAHTLIDLLAEGLKGALVEGGKKRRLPIEDAEMVGRGVLPIPVPTKRSQTAQAPAIEDMHSTPPSNCWSNRSTPDKQNQVTAFPTPATTVVAKVDGAPSEGKPKATVEQAEKGVTGTPPVVTMPLMPPPPPPTKSIYSTTKKLPTSSYSVTTSSQVANSTTAASPVPRFTSVASQGGTKSATASWAAQGPGRVGSLTTPVNYLTFHNYREANSLANYCIRMREAAARSNGGIIRSGAPPLSLIQARMQQSGTNPPTSTVGEKTCHHVVQPNTKN